MKEKKEVAIRSRFDGLRRRLLGSLLAGGGLAVLGAQRSAAAADSNADTVRFPGDEPSHRVVYQFNKGEAEYHQHVLFSVGAVLRKYGDDVHIVVTCFGPGIHILAKTPQRPVSKEIRERVSSLVQYGIEFHACGNTMKSLGWTESDLLPFAKMVDVGAGDLMELQEQGYAYVSW
jgi:intracellular sulfur oxidation DsrE/DsrF family protein